MADGTTNYEIAPHKDDEAPAPRRDLTAYLPEDAGIVERAVFAGMPLDMIDRLRTMAKEERQEKAKLAFMAAKVAAKAEIPRVLKSRKNDHTKSKYADLAAIDEAVTPAITRHGFTLDFTAIPSEGRAGYIDVTCTTLHREGHSESFTLPWPLDGEGMKGNTNKTPVQAMKSTITFARRTMKMMAFDIADADDEDGNAGNPARQTIDRDQMDILDALLTEWGGDRRTFFDFFNVKGMADIAVSQFEKAKALLEKKIADKPAPKTDAEGEAQ